MRKINKKEANLGLIIVILQTFIILNALPAESYIINQTNSQDNSFSISNDKNLFNSMKKITGLLSWLFSVKQIGIVSAEDNFNCCFETNSGALCQNVVQGINPSDPEGCSNPVPTKCELTSECSLGTCVINSGESCSANSPKKECETNNGAWSSQEINSVPECKTGACVLGSNVRLTTEKQCKILSQSLGLDVDFRPGLSELDFPTILGDLKEGACTTGGGNCKFSTIAECSSMNGKFYENMLCTNANLETNCQPTKETACVGDKVYFVDSCGNPANIYDSSKADSNANKEYWNTIASSFCNVDINNPNSLQNCGSCNRFAGSLCSSSDESKVKPALGDYVCKYLSCTDEKGNKRDNGEKWCVYDSKFGDGKDPAGSEHYIGSCNNGEMQVDVCGTARGQICTQKVIEENGKSFSTASCVVNEAIKCIDSNGKEGATGECNDNIQCQVTNVDVDKYFKFSMCTPKYPRGFEQEDKSNLNGKICSVADKECTVIYQKQLFGGWKCIANCECEKKKFSEQLNNLCVSLGDCGSYINYIGDGTDNIQVSGAPSVSWNEYTGYANAENGKYIELGEQKSYFSAIAEQTNASVTPEEANSIIASIGASGITTGIMVANEMLTPFPFIPEEGLPKTPVTNFLDRLFSGNFDFSSISTSTFASLGISAAGGIIGALAGKFLANALGISGDAATVLTMATGVAGSVGALYAAQEGYLGLEIKKLVGNVISPNYFYGSMIVTAIIIAIIILGGFGKTKQVKVNFKCLPWQAPTGGDKCEVCNNNPLIPCTKYKCESLGQSCNLINENTDNPLCQSQVYETIPPAITPGEISSGYEFQSQSAKSVSVKNSEGGCIPEFTPVTFDLKTDEYAQCKWSLKRTADYDSMENYPAEGTSYSLKHNFVIGGLSLGLLNANNITGDLVQGFTGDTNIFVKCRDSFGNFNLDDYSVKFCVNSGNDLTPVLQSLTSTSPINNGKIKFGATDVNFTMWTNEPAECKYSLSEGKAYDSMENTMSCRTNLDEHETFGWVCETTLKNLNQDNKIYIKCKDQPWLEGAENESKRNTNKDDFVYELFVSKEDLKIDKVSIKQNSEEIQVNKDSFTEIKGGEVFFEVELTAETSSGIENGKSRCDYGWNSQWIPFLNTNSNTHSQKFSLISGNYQIPVRCGDTAGNEKETTAKFILTLDSSAPKAVRTYYSLGNLNILTDEKAKCHFSFDESKECNFNLDEAESMETGFTTLHSTKWLEGKTYYIKCSDLWDNENHKCAVRVTTS